MGFLIETKMDTFENKTGKTANNMSRWLMFGMGILFIGMGIWFFTTGTTLVGLGVVFLVMGIASIVFSFFILKFVGKMVEKKTSVHQGTLVRYTFSDDSLHVEVVSPSGFSANRDYPYDKMIKLDENDEYFFFYYNQIAKYELKKSDFKLGSPNEFQDFFRKNYYDKCFINGKKLSKIEKQVQ